MRSIILPIIPSLCMNLRMASRVQTRQLIVFILYYENAERRLPLVL